VHGLRKGARWHRCAYRCLGHPPAILPSSICQRKGRLPRPASLPSRSLGICCCTCAVLASSLLVNASLTAFVAPACALARPFCPLSLPVSWGTGMVLGMTAVYRRGAFRTPAVLPFAPHARVRVTCYILLHREGPWRWHRAFSSSPAFDRPCKGPL